MKKNYIIPEAKTILLGSEANMLISVSGDGDPTTPDGFAGMGGENPDYTSDLSNRRRHNIWGEEY